MSTTEVQHGEVVPAAAATNGQAVARRVTPAHEDPIRLGEVLAASGYFSDARSAAQATVKVLAGRELGFGPIASMTGVHIIEGKPSLGGPMLAALVKQHPRYRYKLVELTDTRCVLEFFERFGDEWESCGPQMVFTIEDAARANLAGKNNWKRYPRNMLFWRALSNGVGFYCPDIASGNRVYTPDEFDIDVGEDGQPLDPGALAPTPQTAPPPASPQTENSGCSLDLFKEIRALFAASKASREELGLQLIALGVEDEEIVGDTIAAETITVAAAKKAAAHLAAEPAESLRKALEALDGRS